MLWLYGNIMWQAITSVFRTRRLSIIDNDIEGLATGQFDQMKNVILCFESLYNLAALLARQQ